MTPKNKLETKRWFRALEIAKVVFWHEGYHTLYLEQIENFIRRKQIYSPRIKEELIPELYKMAKSREISITKLVNKIVEEYLDKNVKRSMIIEEYLEKGKAVKEK